MPCLRHLNVFGALIVRLLGPRRNSLDMTGIPFFLLYWLYGVMILMPTYTCIHYMNLHEISYRRKILTVEKKNILLSPLQRAKTLLALGGWFWWQCLEEKLMKMTCWNISKEKFNINCIHFARLDAGFRSTDSYPWKQLPSNSQQMIR